jgi:hypothetical protein
MTYSVFFKYIRYNLVTMYVVDVQTVFHTQYVPNFVHLAAFGILPSDQKLKENFYMADIVVFCIV